MFLLDFFLFEVGKKSKNKAISLLKSGFYFFFKFILKDEP